MPALSPLSLPARIAIAALALLGLIGGWYILLAGGFHHGAQYSTETTFVSGPAAWLMAALFFAMGTIALAALLQAVRARMLWYFLACGAALGPPLFYGLFMQPA